jgi:hypothetical protein
MVAAFERPAAFDRQQGLGLFDNAEQGFVPSRVTAERTGILFRNVKTDGAKPGVVLQVKDCRRQGFGLGLGLTEQEKGQPGRRLVANSRKLSQFCHQPCERRDGV